MANKIEDLRVYQKAMEFWVAVNALIERRGYWKDRKLRDQIVDANDSITANISEGFEQPTDAAFVQYLFHAKGSLAEVLSRLRTAHCKRYITDAELDERFTTEKSSHGASARSSAISTAAAGTIAAATDHDNAQEAGTGDQGPRTRDPGPGTRDRGPD